MGMISSDVEFQPLLIAICSFGKNQGGSPGYATRGSVIESLEAEDGRSLLDRRNKIFQMFKKGEILFDHSDEREHAYNEHFVCGPDLGGAEISATYLPAVKRYNGRFYRNLDLGSRDRLLDPSIRTLIISGLYGFLEPSECIQCYSIPVEWGNNVQQAWCQDDLLTRILISYLRKHKVTHIFEMTAREDYRTLIDWHRVKDVTGIQIRHCFARDGAGERALEFLGKYIGGLPPDQVADQLFAIPVDRHPKETGLPVYIRTEPHEYDGLPIERKAIPPENGLFFWEIVPDQEARRIFESGETLLRLLMSTSANLGDDPGSIFFMYYGKGLEVLLSNHYGKKMAAAVWGRRYAGSSKFFNELLIQKRSPSIGSWVFLKGDLQNTTDPVIRICKQFFDREISTKYETISAACESIGPYRNKADHNAISSITDLLEVRKKVVNHLNQVLFAIYGKPVILQYHRRALLHGSIADRQKAATVLAKLGDKESVPRLITLLNDQSIGASAARALGILGDERALPALKQIVQTSSGSCQGTARDAITVIQSHRGQRQS